MSLSDKIQETLDKVKNSSLEKARSYVVGELNDLTDGAVSNFLQTTDTLSGIVPDDGANEAVKRFELFQTHTNRPKNSQQFYVLFHPRHDLIYQNIIAGTPGSPSGLLSDLKAWGKKQLDSVGNYFSSVIPEWMGGSGEGAEMPSWMRSIGSGLESIGDKIESAYNAVKGTVDTVTDWAKRQSAYIFGTSGSPDQVVLFQPIEYYSMQSGWLSSFAIDASARAAVVEFGIFAENDSMTALQKMCDEISMHCVDTDRPSWDMPVTRYNQYNRDRLVYEKVKLQPITMTFYDTIDSCLLKLLLFQLAFVSDSYLKEFRHFTEYTQLENFMNNPGNWGMNLFSNVGIFNAISLVEIWGDQCTVYNLQMPKITSVKLSRADASRSDVHKITVTFEYEGLTNINPITLEQGGYDIMLAWAMSDAQKAAAICEKVRMRYMSSTQMVANIGKDFFIKDGDVVEKITNLAQSAGFGSEIKLTNEIVNAVQTGNWGSVSKQLVNPSSITSKISRIF